jgi:hypothetical protein
MPDTRAHRGPHPEDAELFHPSKWPDLQAAVGDYSLLLGRGYASPSAIKVVGDRYSLNQRQRMAVVRSSCTDAQRDRRRSRQISPEKVVDQILSIDGFNVLTTIEVALSHGVILAARDGTYRNIASVHGTYRKVEETRPAIDLTLVKIHELNPRHTTIYLDTPVGNSGRLATIITQAAAEHGIAFDVRLVPNPDVVLMDSPDIVATADSVILDRTERWFNLARHVVDSIDPPVPTVPMSS